jgi:hypothetical protein
MGDSIMPLADKFIPQGQGGLAGKLITSQQAPEEEPIDKTTSGVDLWDRVKVQNLSPTPEGTVQYLNSLKDERGQPKYEAQQYGEGFQIKVRRPGEKVWKVVDPEGADWGDLLDIWGDVGVGAASTVGAIGGAALGTPAAPGVGTVALGAAGGAAGAAAGETVRQGVGKLMGMGDMSGGEIAKQAAFGAGGELLGQGLRFGAKGIAGLARGGGRAVQGLTQLPGEVVERVVSPGAAAAKGEAIQALKPLYKGEAPGVLGDISERGVENLGEGQAGKLLGRIEKPLPSLRDVRAAAEPMRAELINRMESDLMETRVGLDKIKNAVKHLPQTTEEEVGEVLKLGMAAQETERYLQRALGGASKGKTMRMMEFGNKAQSAYKELLNEIPEGLEQLGPEEIAKFGDYKDTAKVMANLNRRIYKPAETQIPFMGKMGMGAASALTGGGAGFALGGPVGAAIGAAAPYALKGLGRGAELSAPYIERGLSSTTQPHIMAGLASTMTPISGTNQWVSKPDTFMQWAQSNQDPSLQGPIQKLTNTLQTRGKDAFMSELYVLMQQYPALREASKQVTGIPSNHSHLTNNKASPRG